MKNNAAAKKREFNGLLPAALLVLSTPFVLLVVFVLNARLSEQFYSLHSDDLELIRVASQYVDKQISDSRKTPTDIEFSLWAQAQKEEFPGLDSRAYRLVTSKFPMDLIKNVGAPPKNGYVLEFWNGDVMVSYASWSAKKHEAYITESEYFPFGDKVTSILIPLGVSLILIGSSVYIIAANTRNAMNANPNSQSQPTR